jgi:hypothetical protein
MPAARSLLSRLAMMMRNLSMISLLLIGACGGLAERAPAAEQLATACEISVDEASSAIAPDEGDPTLDLACCTGGGCTPMDYPDTICMALPDPSAAIVLEPDSDVGYGGDWTTAHYEGCDDGFLTDSQCDGEIGAYVFVADANTHWVAELYTGEDAITRARLFRVPDGGGPVRIPSGREVQPLLDASDRFADLRRPVQTPDGIRYINKQLDCIPRPGACGFTCYKC